VRLAANQKCVRPWTEHETPAKWSTGAAHSRRRRRHRMHPWASGRPAMSRPWGGPRTAAGGPWTPAGHPTSLRAITIDSREPTRGKHRDQILTIATDGRTDGIGWLSPSHALVTSRKNNAHFSSTTDVNKCLHGQQRADYRPTCILTEQTAAGAGAGATWSLWFPLNCRDHFRLSTRIKRMWTMQRRSSDRKISHHRQIACQQQCSSTVLQPKTTFEKGCIM